MTCLKNEAVKVFFFYYYYCLFNVHWRSILWNSIDKYFQFWGFWEPQVKDLELWFYLQRMAAIFFLSFIIAPKKKGQLIGVTEDWEIKFTHVLFVRITYIEIEYIWIYSEWTPSKDFKSGEEWMIWKMEMYGPCLSKALSW